MTELRYLTAGESHGRALVGILEGLPAGLAISPDFINHQLRRRQQGYGRGGRMKIEEDKVEILAGLRFGKTLGSPLALKIRNKDWENWRDEMDTLEKPTSHRAVKVPRPGHADLAGVLKYRHQDIRNVLERSSARETAMRVAIAAVMKQLLGEFDINIASHVLQIKDVRTETETDLTRENLNEKADQMPLRCLDQHLGKKMITRIKEAKKRGDTVGGVFEVIASGLPVGLGSYVHWDRRLEGQIAHQVMSIPAIKSVEIGLGKVCASKWGSEVHDQIFYSKDKGYYRTTNNAGGIEGGITNGEPVVVKVAMKPLPTLAKPLSSVHIDSKKETEACKERADVCAVPAASIIGEAVVALVLAKAFLRKYGGDSMDEIRENYSPRRG